MNEEKRAVAKTYKRQVRNILIHRPMQREFTFILIALLMISTLVIGFFIHETIREAAFGAGFHFGKINPYEVLNEVRYQLLVRVFLVLFITIIILGAFGITFLHRVAGPMYRLHRIFLRMNEGDVEKIPVPIRFREGDFFHETGTEIDRMVMRMRFEAEQKKLIKEKLDGLLALGPNETMTQSVNEIKVLLQQEMPLK